MVVMVAPILLAMVINQVVMVEVEVEVLMVMPTSISSSLAQLEPVVELIPTQLGVVVVAMVVALSTLPPTPLQSLVIFKVMLVVVMLV